MVFCFNIEPAAPKLRQSLILVLIHTPISMLIHNSPDAVRIA
jgi:hypothetical protein